MNESRQKNSQYYYYKTQQKRKATIAIEIGFINIIITN